ncbi:MAG: hypothetical protein PHT12_01480 [Patescibacteria group bacterium]|nr:hypothetical protein [Patescibacteria group bacterium]
MPKYLKVAIWLALAGTLFSGYLAGTKLFSGTCALGESCPIFLGQPACYFGFTLFFSLFIVTLYALLAKVTSFWPAKANAVISALGILFAGQFVVKEIAVWFTEGYKSYGYLGLSTCAYGLVFFIIVFVHALVSLRRMKAPPPAAPPVTPPMTPKV